MMGDIKYYYCTNDECPHFEKRVPVFRYEEASCQRCGWFMSAVVPE